MRYICFIRFSNIGKTDVFFGDRVLFLSRNSHKIEKYCDINLERPRNIKSPEFLEYRSEILEWIEKDVDFSEEEKVYV